MPASLGEKIGEGAGADVHAWAPGQVVKLFRAGVPGRVARYEAQMTRAAFAAALPVPEVFDEVALEGRYGIVLERLEGPDLRSLSRSGAMNTDQVGAVLAGLAVCVHRTPPPPHALWLRDYIEAGLRYGGEALPKQIASGILPLIDAMSPGDGLCHADLHSGNVIMTAQGPRLVDWTGAVRAPAAYDLAVSHLLFSELAPAIVDDPERPRAAGEAMQAEYARLAGISPAALTAAVEQYLPIACVSALVAEAWPAQRERLIEWGLAGLPATSP